MVVLAGYSIDVFQIVTKPLFYLWIVLIIVLIAWIILKLRLKKKMYYGVVEVVDLGNKKMGFNFMKGGYLGKKVYFKGLFSSGEEDYFYTSSFERIYGLTTEDYQEVNGGRGVVCYRHPQKQSWLFAINQINIKGKEIIAALPPGDFIDVVITILEDTAKEVQDWKDQILEKIAPIGIAFLGIIVIMIVVHFVNQRYDAAAQLQLQAGQQAAETCKNICSEAVRQVVQR